MTRTTTGLIFAALTATALTAAALPASRPAQAAPYWPWCAYTYGKSTTSYCGFISWEQCMDTVAGGRGGHCYRNPESPRAADRAARTPGSAAARY